MKMTAARAAARRPLASRHAEEVLGRALARPCLERLAAHFRDALRDANPHGVLVRLAAMRRRRQPGRVRLHEQPVRRQPAHDVAQRVRTPEGDDPRDGDVVAEVHGRGRRFPVLGEAVQHAGRRPDLRGRMQCDGLLRAPRRVWTIRQDLRPPSCRCVAKRRADRRSSFSCLKKSSPVSPIATTASSTALSRLRADAA